MKYNIIKWPILLFAIGLFAFGSHEACSQNIFEHTSSRHFIVYFIGVNSLAYLRERSYYCELSRSVSDKIVGAEPYRGLNLR